MPCAPCWIDSETLWAAATLLARWFRFQLSEIEVLEVEELLAWVRQARDQIGEERGG
ncbi:MAG: GpE family phage tail protein [Tepidimonas sp.]|uniref:GpE family phage tail protein n=1 Tax=Tepidimonas sp. TaxID=2002775 RepID=UPI00259D4564|nr:GpE family phage tail protein [Tepidimonas sp.]MDM7455769.1 GpE family phage tail protein [Tepidimonas sp.]